jgi:hypothetical protein
MADELPPPAVFKIDVGARAAMSGTAAASSTWVLPSAGNDWSVTLSDLMASGMPRESFDFAPRSALREISIDDEPPKRPSPLDERA